MLETRLLRYFLTIAREESFTRAAELLHISQPTLSRQIRALEEQYGRRLFRRTTQHVSLTGEGILLRRHAEDILALVEKAEQELRNEDGRVAGDIRIGSGESVTVGRVMRAARRVQAEYPGVRFHVVTEDESAVRYELGRGLIDIAFFYGEADRTEYDAIAVPEADEWGVIMRADDALAGKCAIRPEDLSDKPLILSRNTLLHGRHGEGLLAWFGKPVEELDIANTYTMIYNAALMVREGMGYLVSFIGLLEQRGIDGMCVRPLDPPIRTSPFIVWKRYPAPSAAARKFIERLREEFGA